MFEYTVETYREVTVTLREYTRIRCCYVPLPSPPIWSSLPKSKIPGYFVPPIEVTRPKTTPYDRWVDDYFNTQRNLALNPIKLSDPSHKVISPLRFGI